MQQAVTAYYEALKQYGGLDVLHETALRSAMQNLLTEAGREVGWVLVPELRLPSGKAPDGTFLDQYKLRHGYWEAKDTKDDLEMLNLGDKVLEALVREYVGDKVVMHVSRDSTAVHAREKPAKKAKSAPKPPKKRGRPKKGEQAVPKELSRLEKQLKQTPEQALAELSKVCDVGCKQDSKGNKNYWIGFKSHLDWADGGFPHFSRHTGISLKFQWKFPDI